MNSNSIPDVCKHCGKSIDKNVSLLTCAQCKNVTHLNCETLTNEEYQVLSNPVKHPNIYWKCMNCKMSSTNQLSNIEDLAQLIFKQLEELHSKVDFLCKSNAFMSNNHFPQYQQNFFPSFKTNLHSLNSNTVLQQPLVSSSRNNTFVNNYLPNWNKNLNSNTQISKIPDNLSDYNNLIYSDLVNETIKYDKLDYLNEKENKTYSVNLSNYDVEFRENKCENNSFPHLSKDATENIDLETVCEFDDVIIPPPEVPNKEYLLCVLSHVESPSEFYVHVTDESTSNPVDDISEQLANCYNKTQYPIIIPDNLNELVNKFFAALYTDNNWYRVRVLEVTESFNLLVQYVDYGNIDFVTADMLNYLKPELAEVPILAVGCALSHIKAIKNKWTDDQVYYFKSFSGYEQEKIVTAYITKRPKVIDYDTVIEVFLWNNDVEIDGLSLDYNKDILINFWMIQFGIAETNNYDWIEEAEKYSKESNELTLNDTCSKVITSNESSFVNTNQSITNLPKPLITTVLSPSNNVTTNGNNSFESECSLETISESRRLTEQVSSDNANTTYSSLDSKISDSKNKDNIDELLTKTSVSNLKQDLKVYSLKNLAPEMTVFIKITAIQSPHCFFGVLPFGTMPYENINVDTAKQLMDKLKTAPEFQKYKELSNQMKAYYSKTKIQNQFNTSIQIRTLVAAQEDQNIFRAKVIECNLESDIYQLQCIDTGKISSVTRNNIFKLKKEFMDLSEFAVQYSMPNIEPFNCNLVNQRKCTWSEKAKKAFIDFTFGNVFLANILEIKQQDTSNQLVLVDLLNIFEEHENVDDFMISNKYAQLTKDHVLLETNENQAEEKDNNNNSNSSNHNNDHELDKTCKSIKTNELLQTNDELIIDDNKQLNV